MKKSSRLNSILIGPEFHAAPSYDASNVDVARTVPRSRSTCEVSASDEQSGHASYGNGVYIQKKKS